MKNVFRTKGIKDRIMDDLLEMNGFHEVTEQKINSVTQPEWREILSRHFPHIDVENRNVNIDLDTEIITIE